MRRLLALAAVVIVARADGAAAATVSVEPAPSGAPLLVVRAAAGEANRLSISSDLLPSPTTQVTDAVLLTAGAGCRPAVHPSGASEVRCSPGIAGIVIHAGDGDDEVDSVLGVPLTVDGGPGNDRLTGMAASTLRGGAGDDELTGSDFADALYSGPGTDYLASGLGDDLLDATGSSATFMEAGPGNDVLVGGPSDDYLEGDEGDDTLTGNGGVDDHLAGGGNDLLRTRDGISEEVECGPGHDRLDHDITDYAGRRAARTCEGADFAWPDVVRFWVKGTLRAPPFRLKRGRRLPVDFKCARADCFGRVRLVRLLTRRKEILYRHSPWTRIRAAGRKKQLIKVRLNRRQRRHLTRRRWLVLNFFVETEEPAGRRRYAVVRHDYLGDPTFKP